MSSGYGPKGLSTFVSDERDDHAVEIEEEHQEVKAELDEGFFLVRVELSEDLGGVQKVLVFEDPAESHISTLFSHLAAELLSLSAPFMPVTRCEQVYVLLPIPYYKWQIQQQRQPVAVDEEQRG